jgi:hypothetical protein
VALAVVVALARVEALLHREDLQVPTLDLVAVAVEMAAVLVDRDLLFCQSQP